MAPERPLDPQELMCRAERRLLFFSKVLLWEDAPDGLIGDDQAVVAEYLKDIALDIRTAENNRIDTTNDAFLRTRPKLAAFIKRGDDARSRVTKSRVKGGAR